MDAPPPSQLSQTNLPQIFRHDDASSMQIFTEAGGIHGRPLLMRKLRGHGATICNDPKSADIILVNPHTSQGRHFIRNWGGDESKVVLEYTWASKSIQEGKALVADDDWGDCIARDDGGPIGDEEDEDEVPKSPLPTPRITPTERKKSTPKIPEPTQQSFGPPTKRHIKSPPSTSTSASTPSSNIDPMYSMPGMSQPMPQPMPQPMSPFNPMMAMSPAQFPVQMAAAMMNPMLMQQMFAAMMMNQPGVQYNEEFQMALSDIMKFQPTSQMQPPAYSQPRTSPMEEPALPYPAVNSKPSHSRRLSVSEFSDSPSPRFVDKKGKQRAASPPIKRRKLSNPSHTEKAQTKPSVSHTMNSEQSIFVKYGRPLGFFIQIDLHNRSGVVTSIRKHGGKIEKDMEVADYVILYSAHKKQKTFGELLKSAQMSGKIAVPSKYIHECIEQGELLPAEDYAFDSVVPGKRKRQSSVIVESESEHESAIERERKRLAKNEREKLRRDEMKLEKARLEKAEQAAKAHQSSSSQKKAEAVKARQPSSQITPQKKAQGQNGSTSGIVESATSGRRTPPIPGEHTRQPWGGGFKFSGHENEFAIEYAQVLIERDHSISATALAGEIHKKLPHHTLKSWRTQFAKITQNDLDVWRKRATIAYRKAMRQSQPGPSAASPSWAPEGLTETRFSSPANPNEVSQATDYSGMQESNEIQESVIPDDLSPEERKLLEEDDLNVISTFFASADATETDDVVWAKLNKTHHCYSEPTWQQFYANHFQEVQIRHQEIMDAE